MVQVPGLGNRPAGLGSKRLGHEVGGEPSGSVETRHQVTHVFSVSSGRNQPVAPKDCRPTDLEERCVCVFTKASLS